MINQVEQLEVKTAAKPNTLPSSPVGKIIVVDDEPELRKILVETLSARGFEVTGCNSGQQALAELRQKEFDLLLTDLMMPEMDGIALLQAALKVDPHLIGIMMTGQGTIQTAVEVMKLGAFDYVLKPFQLHTLMPVLTRAIDTRRLRMENLQLRETVAIYGLCQTIAFTLDAQTVLSRLADAAIQQSDADEVSILLPTNDGKELFVAAVRGEKRERLLGERVPLQESISSWVARERTPLILSGEVNDERFVALWPRPEIRSAVLVPMQVANKLVGIINLNVTSHLRPFTPGQMKALTILASTAAAALESASLYTQVRQAEKNYRSIFENAVEGIFQSTSDRRFLTVNPALAHILGYDSPEEVVACFTDLDKQLYVDPQCPAQVTQTLNERGVLQGFEFEAYRKDGEKIWLSLNIRAVHDETGAEKGREGTIEDITERKRAEEALRQSESQLAEAQRLAHIGSWNWDLQKNVLTWSDEHYRIFGVQRGDISVNHDEVVFEFIHPEDRELVRSVAAKSIETKESFNFYYRIVRRDGEERVIHSTGSLETDVRGRPIRMFGTAQDVTERRRIEQELRQSEERYRDLVENAHDLIYEHDLNGNYTSINKAAEMITGYTLEESLKLDLAQAVAPEYQEKTREMLRRNLAGETVTAYELEIIGKDGHRVPVEVNTRLVLKDGVPVGIQGIARDITERKRVEEIQARRAAHALFRADVSAALAMSRAPLRATLESCATAMVQHLGAAFARVWTLNREEEMLELQASAGMYTHIDGPHARVPVGSFKIGKIAQELAPHITNEVQTDPRVSDKEWARREGMVAFAGYPLLLENRLLGVMAMFSREELAEDTLDSLASVADLISQGIERKRAEEGLRESEERYRLLFESNPQPMWVYDLETLAFLAVNESAVHHYGYSREDFLGMTINDIRPADDIPALYESVARGSEGVDAAGTWRHLKKDGTIIDVEITSHLLVFDDRRAELILAHDITGRRQAEEALRESEARKRAIVESAMDCIITMDHAGLVVDWNPAAEKTFGYTQQEAIGREMAALIIPQRFREQHRQGLARYVSTGEGRVLGQRLELSAQRRDGAEFPVELTITRIESKGAPMFTGYLRDITERKKAENRLSAQYTVTRALAESNTINEGASKILQAICESLAWEYGSLWTVDGSSNVLRCSQVWMAPGSESEEFETASRQSAFTRGTGLPGRVWNDSQPVWIADVVEDTNFPRSSIAAKVGLHGCCAFPIGFRSEILGVVEFFSRSIRESDAELLAMMVTIGSQIGQFIERKRVEEALGESEEQLRQSQKLEAVGQLAGGVAHDFNNLLTVIGGYSSIMLGKLPKESPHLAGVEEIKKASDRASALTRQLLAFSRKQILQPKVLDLNIVVTDLEKMVRRLIGEDIDLLTITSPVLGKVKADPGQIEQVLLNLIVNARDAMPKGGKLTIETSNVEHSEEYARRHAAQPGPYVMLAVSDTGCGMDATIQPRVFEPFFTTKGSGEGTGLGLAMVYGIVKQSGGNIWVYSEVERGSTFKIYLPRADEVTEGEERQVNSKSIPKGSEMVLLVEDEDQVRAILKHILEGQGYHVLAASNGEEALSISQDLERDIKLMITDVVMPRMSGRELAERVLAVRPNLPILFMSGYTDDAIVRHGLLDEKLNFIQKPFDLAGVARKVREVLDSKVEQHL